MAKSAKAGKSLPRTRRREVKRAPTEEEVRERAHAIWLAEGMPEGREVDHWLRARRELEREAGLETWRHRYDSVTIATGCFGRTEEAFSIRETDAMTEEKSSHLILGWRNSRRNWTSGPQTRLRDMAGGGPAARARARPLVPGEQEVPAPES